MAQGAEAEYVEGAEFVDCFVDCYCLVHMCNKLASRHVQVGLATPSEAPRCDICENAPAFFYCETDGISLCLQCDMTVHVGGDQPQPEDPAPQPMYPGGTGRGQNRPQKAPQERTDRIAKNNNIRSGREAESRVPMLPGKLERSRGFSMLQLSSSLEFVVLFQNIANVSFQLLFVLVLDGEALCQNASNGETLPFASIWRRPGMTIGPTF
ncbi:hypothetical protein DKX38_007726 [Salix brachista]|uniref:B box-type domain-containing protein n=1 Tax=Salix brachista TaxID=2182728 RepID=A0A5N5MP87_9ROSI|nr:hypothetical protein DKX38_007726 [Salix brachista]